MTGVLPLTLETNEGVANTLLNMEWYGLGLDYIERYNDLYLWRQPCRCARGASISAFGPLYGCGHLPAQRRLRLGTQRSLLR